MHEQYPQGGGAIQMTFCKVPATSSISDILTWRHIKWCLNFQPLTDTGVGTDLNSN